MYTERDKTSTIGKVIDTGIGFGSCEPVVLCEELIELLVPEHTSLFQAVEGLEKFTDEVGALPGRRNPPVSS